MWTEVTIPTTWWMKISIPTMWWMKVTISTLIYLFNYIMFAKVTIDRLGVVLITYMVYAYFCGSFNIKRTALPGNYVFLTNIWPRL